MLISIKFRQKIVKRDYFRACEGKGKRYIKQRDRKREGRENKRDCLDEKIHHASRGKIEIRYQNVRDIGGRERYHSMVISARSLKSFEIARN